MIRKTCAAISLALVMLVSTSGVAWAGGDVHCIYLTNGMQACLP